MTRRTTDPRKLSPREAWQRYIDRRRTETTSGSMKTYHYRLKLFVEWCEAQNIQYISSLSGWDFETFETARRGEDIAPTTLAGEMQTLKNFIQYLERIEAVDEHLSEKIAVPNVDPDDESSDTKLAQEDAMALLRYYRNDENAFGSRKHAMLELFWNTGARMGAIRGLDLRDYDRHDRYVEFHHRVETGTPLKNKRDGERPVGISEEVCDALNIYIAQNRWEKRDDHGRQPVFTTTQGRPSKNTVRSEMYRATMPCRYGECPHDRVIEDCDYRDPGQESKCPSTRSPHQIRTGSITWQLDQGLPPEVVSKRVNASVKVIKKHYDKASAHEEMERRRRPYLDRLSFD